MRRGGLILAAGRVSSKKKKWEKKHEKIPPYPKHTTKSTEGGDHDHLETARDETRPTR